LFEDVRHAVPPARLGPGVGDELEAEGRGEERGEGAGVPHPPLDVVDAGEHRRLVAVGGVLAPGRQGLTHLEPPEVSIVDPATQERRGGQPRQQLAKGLYRLASNVPYVVDTLPMLPRGIDALDARLIRALCDTPRAGVMELARQLGVARGTVQARLDKLQQRGVIVGFDPDLDLRAMGYEVLAFVSLEIAQGRLDDVCSHLREIPEVLEIHSVTGPGDLHCRVVAHTN